MTTAAPAPLAATRILIVDDSRAIQAIVRRVVERIGYPELEVRSAGTGDEALQAVGPFQPQLVLSDWHMPKMSGIEMFQTMRQDGLGHIKVGFITTESSPRLLEEARNNGAAFILHKPFRDEDLVREITAVLPLDGSTPVDAVAVASPEQPTGPSTEPSAEPPPEPPAEPTEESPPEQPPEQPPEPPAPLPPPTPEQAPAARSELLDEDALFTLVRSTLGEIPFRIIRHETLKAGELSASNLLGLYGSGKRAVAAVAVLDTKSICILGGGAAGLMPNVVRAAMAAGQPSEQMVELASKFLRAAAGLMVLGGGLPTPTLSKASLVPQTMKKLEEILSRSVRRIDCRIAVPGYGEGRFSFLAV